jgi:glycosyltransferase involved in cell wall biosynthesis
MWQDLSIGVVVPAFNEMARIGLTLDGIPAFVNHIVVVDDASTDSTREAVLNRAERRVHLVAHDTNQGVGAAIRTGYRACLGLGADILVVMAADNQMDPEGIEPLLTALREHNAEYVKGNRFLHPDHASMPILRRLGSKALSWLTRVTTGYAVDDCQCGFTALHSKAAERLPLDELWPRYGYPNDLLALLRRINATVVEVPVKPIYAGESSGLHAGHMFSIATQIIRRGVERYLRV